MAGLALLVRRRCQARKMTNAMKERKRHAPIVPPTMAPILGPEDALSAEDKGESAVGVDNEPCVTVAVTVLSLSASPLLLMLLEIVMPRVWYAVLVNLLSAHPCCVMTIFS